MSDYCLESGVVLAVEATTWVDVCEPACVQAYAITL